MWICDHVCVFIFNKVTPLLHEGLKSDVLSFSKQNKSVFQFVCQNIFPYFLKENQMYF